MEAEAAWLISSTQTTLIALGLGCILALVAAMAWLRPPVMAPVQEGRRLMDSIGWAALLPVTVAGYFLISNPKYLLSMWNDGSGQWMLVSALLLQVFGCLALWRMLRSL